MGPINRITQGTRDTGMSSAIEGGQMTDRDPFAQRLSNSIFSETLDSARGETEPAFKQSDVSK